jgi:uncharacterized YigZ family protein
MKRRGEAQYFGYGAMTMEDDHFVTLASGHRASVRIERSEFVGIAFPVELEADFFRRLAALEKKMFDATHHCWAFRIREGETLRERSSDAGEPSGTAGRPILGAIESTSLVDAAVIVVRYYGGVKLGTGGLARAYREAATAALEEAPRRDRYICSIYRLEVPYSASSAVYRMIAPPGITLLREEFSETTAFEMAVRRSAAARFEEELTAKRIPWRGPEGTLVL